MDTIDMCVDGQYLTITEDEYNSFGVVLYRETGEIKVFRVCRGRVHDTVLRIKNTLLI